jgi:hypothetical protein
VRVEDRSLLAKDRKKTALSRWPLADDSWRTNVTPESDFSKSWLLFFNRRLFFSSSWPLVMGRESTAEDSESLAMKS